MFSELIAHLGSTAIAGGTSSSRTEADLGGNFFLVTEAGEADASFLIHHFLSQYLKGGCRVVFLALAQSLGHYNAVAQKLGVNLTALKTSGQLDFISGLQYSLPLMRTSISRDTNDNVLGDCIDSKSLQPLYKLLRESLEISTGSQTHLPTLLLIDDVGILHSLGVDTGQINDFLKYCQATLMRDQKQSSGSMVTLLHCDPDDDDDVVYLSNQLQHACTCHLKVEGLPSGFCKDVHGQMTIIQKPTNADITRPTRKLLQFKITDKNVSFFAVGTSSAVL